MKPLKIAAIILVTSAGVVGSYLIVKNALPTTASDSIDKNQISELSKNLLNKAPLQWLEKNKDTITNSSSDLDKFIAETVKNTENTAPDNKSGTNLTEFVAKSMFNRMQTLDQSGSNPFSDNSFDPNDPGNQKLLAETIASLQDPSTLFNQTVDDKDLKISSDNSRENKILYLKGIEGIAQKYFNDPKYQRTSDQVIKDINTDCFGGSGSLNQEIANLDKNLTTDYLNLSAPSDWADFHKSAIVYFKETNLVYQALANCSNDPIKGYLAAQALPQLLDDGLKVRNLLNEKYNEAGLGL